MFVGRHSSHRPDVVYYNITDVNDALINALKNNGLQTAALITTFAEKVFLEELGLNKRVDPLLDKIDFSLLAWQKVWKAVGPTQGPRSYTARAV